VTRGALGADFSWERVQYLPVVAHSGSEGVLGTVQRGGRGLAVGVGAVMVISCWQLGNLRIFLRPLSALVQMAKRKYGPAGRSEDRRSGNWGARNMGERGEQTGMDGELAVSGPLEG